MSLAEILLIIILALGLIGGALIWQARRLDSLHKRVVSSLAVLDAQLVKRAQISMRLAASDVLDEASKVIISQAAWGAGIEGERLVGSDPVSQTASLGKLAELTTSRSIDRAHAESELTVALRTALGEADDVTNLAPQCADAELLGELQASCHRVRLARKFHNDAVESVRKLRSRWLVRTARLAGHAALPHEFVMDDEVFVEGTTP